MNKVIDTEQVIESKQILKDLHQKSMKNKGFYEAVGI